MITELYALRILLWLSSVFGVGLGVSLNAPRPCLAFSQSLLHSFRHCRWIFVLADATRYLRSTGSATIWPRLSYAAHPVASFAVLSAASFPSTPLCAGIQYRVILYLGRAFDGVDPCDLGGSTR